MRKSIPLLKDLTPPSEDTIDSCTQLSPLHRPRPVQTKQRFIVSYSETPIFISPQMCEQHLVIPFPFSEPKQKEGGWLENRAKSSARGCGNLPQLLCQGAAASVLTEQQWRGATNLTCTKIMRMKGMFDIYQ